MDAFLHIVIFNVYLGTRVILSVFGLVIILLYASGYFETWRVDGFGTLDEPTTDAPPSVNPAKRKGTRKSNRNK